MLMEKEPNCENVIRFCDPKTKNIMKYIIQRNCDCQRPGRGENR